jgi:capsular exopolysaccharide synthesis family protein
MTPTVAPRQDSPAQELHRRHWGNATRPIQLVDGSTAPDSTSEVRRLVAGLKFHWFLLLVLGSCLGGGLGYAAWELLPSKYTTYSVLRVSMLDPSILGTKDAGRSEFVTYMKTQANLIKSPFVLRAAMRDSKIANTQILKKADDPVQWLEENLLIEFSENSEILKISLTGDNAQELAEIVNAVHKAYLKEIVENERKVKQNELTRLEEVQKRWEDYLKAKETNLQVPPKPPIGSAAADVAATKPKIGPAEATRLSEEFRRTQTDLQVARTKYNEMNVDLARLDTIEATAPEIDELLDRDPNYKELTFRAERARKQAEDLKSITTRFPNADYDNAVERASTATAAAEDYRRELKTRVTRDMQRNTKGELLKRIKEVRFEAMALETRSKELAAVIATIPPFVQESPLSAPVFTYDPAKSDMIHSAKTMEMILDRINLLKVEVQAPPRVRELQQASVPIKKEMKKQLLGTGFAAILGIALVGAGITLFERKVNRLFSSKDVGGTASMNVIGTLPDLSSSEGMRPTADGMELMNDAFMEGIDKVRLQLTRNFLGERSQVILVSSAERGEGKTTLAGHLAVSLTKVERKTILLDANFRHPEMHEHLGLPAQPGLSEFVRGEKELQETVQATAIPNLWFMGAGKFDGIAQQAIGRDRLGQVLERLRQEFDFVLIDGHALLPVADSYLVAQHCDAVVLVARKYVSRKHLVEDTYSRVSELGPSTGIIFMGEAAN